jgi:hypothetical protein
MVRHSLPVILSLVAALPPLDGALRLSKFFEFGASLEVFLSVPLGVAGKRASEFLGLGPVGTDRLSADAL